MAYTTIDDPTAYFQTKLYTGNSAADDANLTTSQALTFDGNSDMQPDLLWFKRRDGADHHLWFDNIRGRTKGLYSNLSQAEDNLANSITSFDSDGFTLGNDTGTGGTINKSNETYVAWGWKAGTSFTNDASSTSVGSIDSTGSVNTDAGFSIISWSGTGSNGTIAHGLGSAPKVVLLKERDGANNWLMYHETLNASLGDYSRFMTFNSNGAVAGANNVVFQNSVFTSSVFNVGTSAGSNGNGGAYIAYCFAEKQGYSKFGIYTGNGNADGTFIYTGFKPAWFIMKNTASGNNWHIMDHKRDPDNVVEQLLKVNANDAENTTNGKMDFLSNGVKIKSTSTGANASGATYIYMAFAENPFVTSTGVPATAR